MDVRGQIFRRGEQPQELLPAHARSGFTRPIPRGDPFIPGTLVQAPTVSLISTSRITRNRHCCIFPPLGAQTPASRIFRIKSFGTGSGFNLRIERVVFMISNRSVVLAVSSGIAYPFFVRATRG